MTIALLDLEQHPLDKPDSPRLARLVATMRAELASAGASCLRNFVSADGIERLRAEAHALVLHAFRGPSEASPYFFDYQHDKAASLPADHPLNTKTPRRLSQVATDLIPEDSLLRSLYLDGRLVNFFARVLAVPELFPSADRYQALNISVMEGGGCQQWHFDRSECVITLLLQAPQDGGVFEYVPGIRSDDNEHYDDVKAVIGGDRSRVKSVALDAGTLMFFRGVYSLHRVTPVVGTDLRLQSILAYNPRPGVIGSIESSVLHYGERVREDLADASADHVVRY
ncbi:MAG: arpA protein [Gammaproteobacteria bacterium]|nr:arpA protein [Gammaproteobacteria bacterium]